MSKAWVLIILISCFITIKASIGDRSQFYSDCIYNCRRSKCKNANDFKEKPSLDLKLLLWTCKEDCRYSCMWETVNYFTSRGLHIPQFHGKWPFIRIFGLQEPASVIFSLLNLYTHATYYIKFKNKISSSSPMFFVWTWFTAICVHGWFWSAVFHARDTDFTEAMDYSCAFSIVLTLLYCLLVRVLHKYGISAKVFIIITSIYFTVLYFHFTHLWSGQINYGYNMKFNIVIGFLTFVITMVWWYRNYTKLSHIHLIGWFTVLTVSVTLLEVADFPPIFWIIDAHSLWHASTIPLVHLLYSFISMDCLYLRRQYSKLETDRL